MKTLYLLRHAKSSWDDASQADFDRPLNDRGRRTAPLMGELMKERGLLPAVIVSSPAVRARETAAAVASAASLSKDILYEQRVYEASPNELRTVIAGLDDQFPSAMLVGHNPGMEGIVYYLTGRAEPMPTAALAVLELDIDSWQEANADTGRLVTVIRPKEVLKDRQAQ